MKKILTIILLCIVFVIIYLLQINLFSWFTIAGIKPNIFVILVLWIGLFTGRKYGAIMGAIFGFAIDILGSKVIGISSIVLGIIGFAGGYFEKNLSKDSKITVILLVMGSTAVYEIFVYIYKAMVLSSNIEILIFIQKLLIEIIYNALITIILYPLMQKFGYKMEDIFKNPQILTRYF